LSARLVPEMKFLKNPEIKFGRSATRADLLASLDHLAELGERLDGPYRLAAAYVRGQLKVGAAIRLKRRDDAILELRLRWHAHQSNNAAAKEIQSQLNRYAASAWRGRRALDEPTPAECGTYREQLWRILKEGDGQVLGSRRIRQIVDLAPKQQRFVSAGGVSAPIGNISPFPLPTLPPTLDASPQQTESALNTRPSFDDVVPIVRELPGFKSAEEKARAKLVADRQAHLDAIGRLDTEATKAYPRQEKLKAEKLAAEQGAIRALKFAANEYQQTLAAVGSERLAYERDRRAHEEALIAGEWPELSAFFDTCEIERARAKAALAMHG
jgi:hypothetical protein